MARVRTDKPFKTKAGSANPGSGAQGAGSKERQKGRKGKGKTKEDVEVELVTGHESEDVRFSPSCSPTLLLMVHGYTFLARSRKRRLFVPIGAQVIQRLCWHRAASCKEVASQGEGETGHAKDFRSV